MIVSQMVASLYRVDIVLFYHGVFSFIFAACPRHLASLAAFLGTVRIFWPLIAAIILPNLMAALRVARALALLFFFLFLRVNRFLPARAALFATFQGAYLPLSLRLYIASLLAALRVARAIELFSLSILSTRTLELLGPYTCLFL